jgi:hypothetical protein
MSEENKVPDLYTGTMYEKHVDAMYKVKLERNAKPEQQRKEAINTLSKLHRPAYVPPKLLHRPTYDFAEGIRVRSFYDGELK